MCRSRASFISALPILAGLAAACVFDTGQFDNRRCTGDDLCPLGTSCVDGFCTAGCPDRDGDGIGFGAVCPGEADCDDTDPEKSPNLQEGPAGAPSCSDAKDNDCDAQVDLADSGCEPCTGDGDCDDGDDCNGVESCQGGSCTNPADVDCDDAKDCTDDTCEPAGGSCEWTVKSGRCLIAGDCYQNGAPDPGNACRECNTSLSQSDWTNDPSNTCNDGLACTHSDVCTTGVCQGTAYTCPDDGLACTTAACDGTGGCLHNVVTGCLITGVCRASGAPNPANPCQVCNPAMSTTAWSNDDSLTCGDGVCAHCQGGVCMNAAAMTTGFGCVADANPCTDDYCDGAGNCIHPNDNTNSCSDGFTCTSPDACVAGACVGTQDDALCSPGQACAPGCFSGTSGCGTPPASLAVTCPATAPAGGAGVTCDIDLGGLANQRACLSCATRIGPTLLDATPFSGCSLNGWAVSGGHDCPVDFTDFAAGDRNAIAASDAAVTLEKFFDTRNMNNVRLCFGYLGRSAGTDDILDVFLNTAGSWPGTPAWTDNSGPTASVSANFVPTCLDLDMLVPGAANNANLGIRLRLTAAGTSRIAVDDVEVMGWQSGFVGFTSAFTEDFSSGSVCDTSNWTVSGSPVCPVNLAPYLGRFALEAQGPAGGGTHSWSIDTAVSATGLCDDVRLGFVHGNSNDANNNDTYRVFYDAGAGLVELWRSEGALASADEAFQLAQCSSGHRIGCSISLSMHAAAAAFHAALGLRYSLAQDSATRALWLDDVVLYGATCAPGDSFLTVGAVTESGAPGSYHVTVSAPAQTTAHVQCSWDDDAAGRAKVRFTP